MLIVRSATELVTPPLDGMILPGVTRDSVLSLAKSHASGVKRLPGLPDKLVVTERPITMKEVQAASRSKQLVELFGAGMSLLSYSCHHVVNISFRTTGTAVVISPVNRIGYMGEDVMVPTESDGMGPVSRAVWKELVGRQTGRIPSEWSVPVGE